MQLYLTTSPKMEKQSYWQTGSHEHPGAAVGAAVVAGGGVVVSVVLAKATVPKRAIAIKALILFNNL